MSLRPRPIDARSAGALGPDGRATASTPPAARRALDRAAVAGFAVVWTSALARLHSGLFDPDFAAVNLAGVAAGYLLADLVAGIVHWIADRHFDPATPFVGKLLIEPFRAHHDDPLSITRHDFFEVLGNNALVAIPATAALLLVPPPSSALAHFGVALALAGTLASVATNLFHGWAHAPRPPRIARWLQARGLILTPRRHALHHRGDHDRAYCVTSGWLNPVLDRTRFFARLDAWIERGLRPRADRPADPSGGPSAGREPTVAR
ncbi:MAG: fatty acid desaturase CarF family protein [Myxococcota bacterium]